MFSYYGSKSKIIDLYPLPIYDTIIEPFAGSAQYALKYYNRKIILMEKYDVLYKIWKWLQSTTEEEIYKLPILKQGQSYKIYENTLSKEWTVYAKSTTVAPIGSSIRSPLGV